MRCHAKNPHAPIVRSSHYRARQRKFGRRPRGGKDRFKIRGLLADVCSQASLDFLFPTDVGRLAPALAEEDAQTEASEWELRERRERVSRGAEASAEEQ